MSFLGHVLVISMIVSFVHCRLNYQERIPNGANVVRNGQVWPGVGHVSAAGGGALNPFGMAFKQANYTWTVDLCQADSDGDGVSNGMELGDPNCTLSLLSPNRTTDISHPGFADSVPHFMATPSTSPVPTITVPSPVSSGKKCSEFLAVECPVNLCFVDSSGLCREKPCDQFSAVDCPRVSCDKVGCLPSRCVVLESHCRQNQVADFCIQFSSSECPRSRCGVDKEKKCFTEVAVPVTQIPTTAAAVPRFACSQISSQSLCYSQSGCEWLGSLCLDSQCASLTSQERCLTESCRWCTRGTSPFCADPAVFYIDCSFLSKENLCSGRSACRWLTGQRCANVKTKYVPQSCSEISDAVICSMQGSCVVKAGSCHQKSCEDHVTEVDCSKNHCNWQLIDHQCRDPCPVYLPVYCQHTKLCAKNSRDCRKCPTGLVQCWDSTCRGSFVECPCPERQPAKCTDGRCAITSSQCQTVCAEGQFQCWEHSCVTSLDKCPCEPQQPVRCSNGRCRGSSSLCDSDISCPIAAPYVCWDYSCTDNLNRCPCRPYEPHRCPSDNKCYAKMLDCPCPTDQKRCFYEADTFCLDKTQVCITMNPCPRTAPARCADSSCKASHSECPCNAENSDVPVVWLSMKEQSIDSTEPLQIAARAILMHCGAPYHGSLATQWAVYGGPIQGNLNLKTDTLTVPAKVLAAGTAYVFRAAVAGPDSSGWNEVVLTTRSASSVRVRIQGGDRVESSTFNLKALIDDPNTRVVSANDVAWRCCIPGRNAFFVRSFRSCESDCPAALHNYREGLEVNITGAPQGSYLVGVSYKAASDFVLLNISAFSVIQVSINISPKRHLYLPVDPLTAYAVFPKTQSNAAIQWYQWGLPISGKTGKRLQLTEGEVQQFVREIDGQPFLRIGVKVLDSSQQGEASLQLMFVQPISEKGDCIVQPVDTAIETARAGETKMRILARGWPDDVRFAFAYKDPGRIPLSNTLQDLPEQLFTAPFLPGNPSVDVAFVVSVAREKRRDTEYVECSRFIASASSVDSSAMKNAKTMNDAFLVGDVISVLQSSQIVVSASRDMSNETEKKRVLSDVLIALTEIFQDRKVTSADERLAVTQILKYMMLASRSISSNATLPLLLNVILPSNSDDVGKREITTGNAKTLLEAVGLYPNGSVAAPHVRRILEGLSIGLPLEQKIELVSSKYNIVAEKMAAVNLAGRLVTSKKSSLLVPLSFDAKKIDADLYSAISFLVIQYEEAPVTRIVDISEEKTVQRGQVSGIVTEFSVLKDQQTQHLSNLTNPFTLQLPFDPNDAEKQLECVYFVEQRQAWSKEGVRNGPIDMKSSKLTCYTSHLSVFAVAAISPETDLTANEDQKDAHFGVGAIAGIGVGALLLLFVVAAFICAQKKEKGNGGRRVHQPGDKDRSLHVPRKHWDDEDPYQENFLDSELLTVGQYRRHY